MSDNELLRVSASDGKYTVIQDADGSSYALRHGDDWQVFPKHGSVGNLCLALAHELDAARRALARMHVESQQARVAEWMLKCFTPKIVTDVLERCHRNLEETLELVQALDMPRDHAHTLVDYVYDRPKGETEQEIGGQLVTLLALCGAIGVSLQRCGNDEIDRISTPEMIEKIREKQKAKPVIGGPLP